MIFAKFFIVNKYTVINIKIKKQKQKNVETSHTVFIEDHN
jgi:hypothetical protein